MSEPTKNPDDKPVRIQFEFSPRLARELVRFEEESEIQTHREFFAYALSLWRWAAQKSREGKTISAIEMNGDEIKYTELTMPPLDNIRIEALAARALVAQPGITAPQEVG